MSNLVLLSDKIKLLQQKANENKELFIHKDNIFNKEVSKILSELGELEIILLRIEEEAGKSNQSSKLKLDIKSLHIFGYIFIESVVYFLRIFFPEAECIEFESIGKFLKSVDDHKGKQKGAFSDFLGNNLVNIQNLNGALRDYRGLISHEKRSTTEWTLTDPLFPMSGSKIINVPWREDKEFQEKISLSPSQFINLVTEEVGSLFDYLQKSVENLAK